MTSLQSQTAIVMNFAAFRNMATDLFVEVANNQESRPPNALILDATDKVKTALANEQMPDHERDVINTSIAAGIVAGVLGSGATSMARTNDERRKHRTRRRSDGA